MQSGSGGVRPAGGGVLWWLDILSFSFCLSPSLAASLISLFCRFFLPLANRLCSCYCGPHLLLFFSPIRSSQFLPPAAGLSRPFMIGRYWAPPTPFSFSLSLSGILVLFCMLLIDWRSWNWQTVLSVQCAQLCFESHSVKLLWRHQ